MPVAFRMADKNGLACCGTKLEAHCKASAVPAIRMAMGVKEILAGATGCVHCCKILPRKRENSIVYILGEETRALMEQSQRQAGDLSINPKQDVRYVVW